MLNSIRKLKYWLRNSLGYSQRETNGFFVLVLCMAAALLAPLVYDWFTPAYDPTADAKLLDSLAAQLEAAPLPETPAPAKPAPAIAAAKPSQPFDPNTLETEDWVRFGLPKHLAERIKKYQANGGMFKTREDVARIYGFPEELYRQLYPYFALPTREEFLANRYKPRVPGNYSETNKPAGAREYKPYAGNRRAPLQLFDINKADSTQLMRIRGIGSKRAEWVLKHRKRLGGFVSTQQFSEVWGLDSAVVDSLQKYAYVAPDFTPQKVYINRMTVDELGRYPYLNFKMARAIIAYREQHGPYTKPDDLRKVKLLNEETIRKLLPYLAF